MSAESPRTSPSRGLSRREMLGQTAKSGAVLGGSAALCQLLWDPGDPTGELDQRQRQVRDFRQPLAPGAVQLAVAENSRSPVELTRKALSMMGGMDRFVGRGDVVAIKPNIGWDRMPVHAANTNPLVVKTLVELALEAGAARVVVTDASCNDPKRCFLRSGIWRAAHDAGADVVLPAPHRFRELRIKGEVLDQWPVYKPLIEADKVINVPVAKHHNLCRFTAGMKNWYGLLGGRRNRLHQNIHVSIADLATFMRPTLTVIDAVRVLVRNGPQGGNIDDARDNFQVIASTDQVAADALACSLIGERRQDIEYLRLAEQRDLGTTHYENLQRVRG